MLIVNRTDVIKAIKAENDTDVKVISQIEGLKAMLTMYALNNVGETQCALIIDEIGKVVRTYDGKTQKVKDCNATVVLTTDI
jgi:hypothetical protein